MRGKHKFALQLGFNLFNLFVVFFGHCMGSLVNKLIRSTLKYLLIPAIATCRLVPDIMSFAQTALFWVCNRTILINQSYNRKKLKEHIRVQEKLMQKVWHMIRKLNFYYFFILLPQVSDCSTISLKVDICDTCICLFLWLKKDFRMDI